MKSSILLNLMLIVFTVMGACSDNPSDLTNEYYTDEYGFGDGTYCALVEYYNPNTGTRSEYTLNVDVESNELVLIHWSNGGWLDEDHFDPTELDNNGYCEFTSNKGYEYTVSISGPECAFTDEDSLSDEIEQDEAILICPRCGSEKEEYEDYCYNCSDEVENTCSECGAYDYGINGDVCRDCQNE
ncbi:hypothetical protein D3C87_430900 [compost metagenome]